MLVRTNKGTLLRADGGLNGPKVLVIDRATSREM